MAKSKTWTQKKMITWIGIALALTLHVPSIVLLGGGVPYSLVLVVDAFVWLFTMFFVVRAVHRPWREWRITAATFFAVGCVITAFVDLGIGSGKQTAGGLILGWVIVTYFSARDINKRVKKAEEEKEEKKKKKREKREKKRQAAEQHAQEPAEQPVQESVEEHAQAPVKEHTEEE